MVVTDSHGEHEVVFVVEGTANLLLHFETLKTEYIDPIIEYINGGPVQESNSFFGDENGPNQYCLVVYGTKASHPEDAVQLVRYTRDVHDFLQALNEVKFDGGGGQDCSLLAEGMGFALQAFDEMRVSRGRSGPHWESALGVDIEKSALKNNIENQSVNCHRHCIVVCNSPPFPQPSRECLSYLNKTVDQLAAIMAKPENNIHLSIISPRKFPALQLVFDKSLRDDTKGMKSKTDYAKEPQHMACLQGIMLPGASSSSPLHTSLSGSSSGSATHSHQETDAANTAVNSPQTIPDAEPAPKKKTKPKPKQQPQSEPSFHSQLPQVSQPGQSMAGQPMKPIPGQALPGQAIPGMQGPYQVQPPQGVSPGMPGFPGANESDGAFAVVCLLDLDILHQRYVSKVAYIRALVIVVIIILSNICCFLSGWSMGKLGRALIISCGKKNTCVPRA